MQPYDHSKIEKKWQKEWASKKVYKTDEKAGLKEKKPKFYILDMFPYPSGEGLHVGHPKGYIATDVVSRMKRMQGHEVLHPMGFDAFGLPAENYAIATKTNPADSVTKNVARYKKQLEILGFDYDWSREINTTDPEYYKWTQWIFLKLFEKGLAYESYEPINWCPKDKTGLANEDVEDGKCERCGTPVEKKLMRQWVLRITDYADRMLLDLDAIEIPEFTNTFGTDAWRPEAPVSERDTVYCIVKHWQDDSYLCMKWKKNDWRGYVIGGIEKGETIEETAIREVQEETGFKNVVFKRHLGNVVAKFYQELKKQNRKSNINIVYLELVNGEQASVPDHEKEIQDIEWVAHDKVRDFVNRPDLKYMWDLYIGAVKQEKFLNWPESIKELQKNWIGRSEGMIFTAPVKDTDLKIQTFSAHFEACYADTFVVIAPDHQLLPKLLDGVANKEEVLNFCKKILDKRALAGREEDPESEGIFTGRYIVDPLGNGDLPIWVASFALADYGTGIVKCSAHDERDFKFAKKYGIKIKTVLYPEDPTLAEKVKNQEICFFDMKKGILTEPKEFNGKAGGTVRQQIAEYLVSNKLAEKKTTYKLRPWVFSRQRYWGEPIPVIHCEKCGIVAVPEKELPVKLPKVEFYEPTGTGESPLAAIDKWVNVKCPKCRGKARRETNTMPQWAGSSWYYLRYMDPANKKALVSPEKERYWAPVDFYVGGAEHATRHLIYARFWHKFLYDIGVVSTIEPFKRLQHVGLIMAEDGRKMSKRYGNVVNPDEIVKNIGADSMRVYEMFMGPFDQSIGWNTNNAVGSRRFIERVWRLQEKVTNAEIIATGSGGHNTARKETLIHKTIKKVTEDIGEMRFNTAISTMMITVNELEKDASISHEHYDILLKLLAPFAPHVTEELWGITGHNRAKGSSDSIHTAPWPAYDPTKIVDVTAQIIVQVNGKVRTTFETETTTSEDALKSHALNLAEIKKWIADKPIKKVIIVKGRLVNIVI